MKVYSKSIAEAISNYLTENEWPFYFNEKSGQFKFDLSMKHNLSMKHDKIKRANYLIEMMEDRYVVYVISPIGADVRDRKTVGTIADFIYHVNNSLLLGAFEFDEDSGEICFKSIENCKRILPTNEVVRNSIFYAAAMFEQYSAGIIDIIFNNATALEAVERCEKAAEADFSDLLGSILQLSKELDAACREVEETLLQIKKALTEGDEV